MREASPRTRREPTGPSHEGIVRGGCLHCAPAPERLSWARGRAPEADGRSELKLRRVSCTQGYTVWSHSAEGKLPKKDQDRVEQPIGSRNRPLTSHLGPHEVASGEM